jgi:hypothetical protein
VTIDEVLEQSDVTREQIHAVLEYMVRTSSSSTRAQEASLRNQSPLPPRSLPRSRLQNRLYPNLQDWQFVA